jgi:hypothetical protein
MESFQNKEVESVEKDFTAKMQRFMVVMHTLWFVFGIKNFFLPLNLSLFNPLVKGFYQLFLFN